MKHDLFISYAHRSDRVLVEGRQRSAVAELKRQLEKHTHPRPSGRRRRRFRVCTDTEDLELHPTVTDAQRAALEESASLLVICSEASAESRYVCEEIETFQALRGEAAQILAGDMGLRPDEAFPGVFEEGVLGADLAPAEGISLREWRSKLASESHKIVAKVWDVPLAEVHDRFLIGQRKQRTRSVLLALFGVALLLLAWSLVRQVEAFREEEQSRQREEFNAVMRDVQRSYEDGQINHARRLLEEARRPEWDRLRSFAWDYFWQRTGVSAGVLRSDSQAGWSLSMAPEGELLAAGMGSTVRLWNWRTQQLEQTLRGHATRVHATAFSPDGSRVASGGQDRTVRVWSVETGQELVNLEGHTEPVWDLTWTPDGTSIVSVAGAGDRGEVLFWGADSAQLESRLKYEEPVRTVDVSKQGQLALGCGRQMSKSWIEIRDLETREVVLTLEDQARIEAVRFFPDGQSLASVGAGHRAQRWDLKTQRVVRRYFGHESWIHDLAISSDGRLLASGSSDGTVRLWDAETGAELAVLRGHLDDAQTTAIVNAVAFSADGSMLASTGTSLTLRLWNVERAQIGRVLEHESPVLGIALSPDESLLASVTREGRLRIWQTQTHRMLLNQLLSEERLTSVAFSSDGRTLAVGSNDGAVRLVETVSGVVAESLETGWSWVEAVDVTAGGLLAAGGGDHGERGGVAVWRLASRERVLSWADAPDVLHAIDFDPQGLVLMAAGEEGAVELDVANGSLVASTPGNQPVAFNAEGTLLAYGVDLAVQLRNLASGKITAELLGHKGWVNCVTFHPDGQTVATGGSDGTIRLWDVETGDQRLVLQGHEDQTLVLVFAGNGRRLYSAGADDVVKVWDVSEADP